MPKLLVTYGSANTGPFRILLDLRSKMKRHATFEKISMTLGRKGAHNRALYRHRWDPYGIFFITKESPDFLFG